MTKLLFIKFCIWQYARIGYNREMEKNKIIIYTDGSSLGNPGPGGWGAIIIFGKKRVKEIGGGDKKTTNNRMELTAAIEALCTTKNEQGDVELHTDSQYVKNGITKWVIGWQQKGWLTAAKEPVLNRDLWEKLIKEETRRKRFGKVEWNYIAGHAGHSGNERADIIAVSFAEGKPTKLYEGAVDTYKTKVSAKIDRERKSRSKTKAYSYLSFIDGVVQRHETWRQCESRVKGKKAKFRKAVSMKDEKDILNEWGVSL